MNEDREEEKVKERGERGKRRTMEKEECEGRREKKKGEKRR